jgi:hypothetical protein
VGNTKKGTITMQDLRTGEMRDISAFFNKLPTDATAFERRKALDEACQKAEPDPKRRGPVFEVGEVLEIRGGKFQVTKIEPGHLRLKSLPSI